LLNDGQSSCRSFQKKSPHLDHDLLVQITGERSNIQISASVIN
jgi:hypothetical protein